MDEFGKCITETVQRQHDEKKSQGDGGAGVHVPDCVTLVQGVDTAGREQDAAFQEDLARAHGGGRLGRRSTNQGCIKLCHNFIHP